MRGPPSASRSSSAGSATWRGSFCPVCCPAIWPYNAVVARGESDAMMVFLVCAGLLGLLGVALTFKVGSVRGRKKIFLGDGGDQELITAMRVQANFVENVPLGLILIGLLGSSYSATTVATLSVGLLVARLLHASGMLGYLPYGRPAGATLTLIVLAVSAIAVGLSGLGIKLF